MIRYYDIEVSSKLREKRRLSSFLQDLVAEELALKKINITYVFCNDEYLLDKNIQFLNHHTLTDIITFDLSENNKELVAEIYISIPRVQENAKKFEVSYLNELHRVIFHGCLHLCGYKDKSKEQKEEMRKMENQCLTQYFS